MPKYSIILLIMSMFLINDISLAQLAPEQEKRLEDLEQKAKAWETWEKEKTAQEQKLLESGEKDKKWKVRESDRRAFAGEQTGSETGRFQAVRMNNSSIMILDTMEGHLWVWVSQPDQSGKSAEFLIYQGQVVPGSKMGEIINRTFNK